MRAMGAQEQFSPSGRGRNAGPLWVLLALLALLLSAAGVYLALQTRQRAPARHQQSLLIAGTDAGYVDSSACAACHARIYETYQHTGMARSFFRPRTENTMEDYSGKNTFYHRASDRYYRMFQRAGRYYQRRYQIGMDGKETNVVEREIDFVLGSGNHARTYLHKTAQGEIVELPVAWYRERGGYWAMNPGYDRPDHQDFRRRVNYDCMFCHNSFPEIAPHSDSFGQNPVFKGVIPEGIDCQRCHGPGRNHIQAANDPNIGRETLGRTLINPARLSAERQLEVCMQCHLQTTSFRLPASIHRYDRGIFSYRPGQTLADFILHFDHASGSAYDDKFEIVSAAYRLRQSRCFQKRNGSMTCTTCHNPHEIPHGEKAARHYVAVCQSCHSETLKKLTASSRHTASTDCLGCHMPKRRTEDVVHVIMTDHYIQRRRPGRDLLAPLPEKHSRDETAYHGEVILYYPGKLLSAAEQQLYLGVAQVKQNANLQAGIPRLEKAIEEYRPRRAEFYFELAEACSETGQVNKAIDMYQEALHRRPDLAPALHRLGVALSRTGQPERAFENLQRALEIAPDDAVLLNDVALVYRQLGKLAEAEAALRKAVSLNPDLPQAYNNLGASLLEKGDQASAEEAFRNAIQVQPDFAPAHTNLANVLVSRGNFREAQYHFERAVHNDPKYGAARYHYGVFLIAREMLGEAQAQLEAAVGVDGRFAEAHASLGDVLGMRGNPGQAIQHYRRAIELKPDFAAARFHLGAALAAKGKFREALPHLRKAAESADAEIQQGALELLSKIESKKR
jgi:tetratricopeptide (TPR) repeat protein